MDAQHGLLRAERRLIAQQGVKFLVFEDALDDANAIGPLRMAGAHVVAKCGSVAQKEGVQQGRPVFLFQETVSP